MPRSIFAVVLLGLLAACSKPAAVEKTYALEGEIIRLDPSLKIAAIKHGKIGDWMEPMTMEFPVRTQTDFDKLAVGAHVTGTVHVRDLEYSIGEIAVQKP